MLEVDISIHALLAESDGAVVDVIAEVGISIHALLAESDVTGTAKCFALNAFLSTLSLRRATKILDDVTIEYQISIHALLAESDHLWVRIQ